MWFEGAINQALDKSKTENLMLFTFIKGTNENSIKLNNILETNDFKNGLIDKIVALKFDQDSKEGNMFKQIYPFDQVPTIYLISSKATVYEKITGLVDKDDLITKVNAALEKQKQLRVDQTSTTNNETTTTTSLKRANESPAKVDQQQEAQQDSNLKDKELRANELLKDLRVKKQKEEEQRERDLEKERIRTGKELQSAREIQRQKEMEEIVKQREREKLEEKRHRERVLAQIKQDQEDRKARQAGQQQEVKAKPLVISQPTQINSDQTRIQFRLPDSSTIKNVFNIQDTLRTVIRYIEDNTSHRDFKLATSFPAKEFKDADLEKTLIDLKLAPSACLIVKKPPVPQYPIDNF